MTNFDFGAGQNEELSDEERLAFFVEKWDDIELLIEQSQKTKVLVDKLDTYIDDVKGEVAATKWMRWISLVIVALVIAILMGSLFYFLFCEKEFLANNESYAGTAFIIASISASVVLLVTFVRGAFRSIKDRNKDEELPPHIVQVIDVLTKQLTDGG